MAIHVSFVIFLLLMMSGCGDASHNDHSSTEIQSNNTQSNDISSVEQVLSAWDFNSSLQGWSGTFGCNVAHATANAYQGGYLLVSNRSESYTGPKVVPSGLTAGKLYIVRAWVRPNGNETIKLNLKLVGESTEYREIGRSVANAGEWTRVRFFLWLESADIAKALTLYFNTETTGDFAIDEVRISQSGYVPPSSSSLSDFVQTSGAGLMRSGNAVRLKGINLIAYGDDDGASADEVAAFMNYSYYNYDLEDLKMLKAMGFTTIRLALWYKYFESDRGWAWLDTMIGWAKEAGLSVMLDMHGVQGGGFQGPNNVTKFWSGDTYKNQFKTLWVQIATRYHHESTVVAYDLINEPCPPAQTDYETLMHETVAAIRAVDNRHLINVENSFASDSAPFHLSEDSNIMYDFHFYDPYDDYTNHSSAVYPSASLTKSDLQGWFDSYASYYTTHGLPIMVSEFGQKRATIMADNRGALTWISDMIDIFDAAGVNYCYFSFKGNEFGLYDSTNALPTAAMRNQMLADLLERRLP